MTKLNLLSFKPERQCETWPARRQIYSANADLLKPPLRWSVSSPIPSCNISESEYK